MNSDRHAGPAALPAESPPPAGRPRAAGGFTLVELAIAIAVVLIGVLALFALISSGLDSSSKAVADTQAAIFADSVFNAIGSASQSAAEDGVQGNQVMWKVFWRDFAAGTTKLYVPVTNMWDSARDPKGGPLSKTPLPIYGDNKIYALRYMAVPLHASATLIGPKYAVTNVVHLALRYQLTVQPPISDVVSLGNLKEAVTLRVWDGEFGTTNDALIYYGEFDNPGDL
ncbi:MAG: prepilin-type N-terminal cleavage/methylation domain-containing protein [Lentisphaerae bacterium]|nr:prepilin-type N-terminal cleavage/methylation domain-containing protein [Lentisphaerota bacterium]